MTLSAHLDELRSRLIRSMLAAGVGAGLAFWQAERVVEFLRRPLNRAIEAHPSTELIQTTPAEGFMATMLVALFAGITLAGPYILYEIWGFVAAGLYPHERRSVRYYALPGFLLFVAGASLAYLYVLPWALEFLIGFAADTTGLKSFISLGPYLSLVAWMMFIFGAVFQLPLIMVFLMRFGVVEPATFRRYRRWAIVLAFLVGAILTPPDVISQIALSVTLLTLYEGAIFVGTRLARKRAQEEA